MVRVGITGIDGLIGWHLHAFFYGTPDIQVYPANRETFASQEKFVEFVNSCDVIVHLAGMNRGDEKEILGTNIELTNKLIRACEQAHSIPHMIFSSSTHIYRETAYGESKKACTKLFQEWSFRSGAKFANMILPNVFGEGGRPFYNSVLSTFCYQIAKGEQPTIVNDTATEQLHAQDVAQGIYDIIEHAKTGDIRPTGKTITVSDLKHKISSYASLYGQKIIPDLRDRFDLQLFNTYRSYLFPDQAAVPVKLHSDERGVLFEAEKNLNGGQSFISTTKPGVTRGNHYHRNKVERFLVVSGEAEIRLRKLFSDRVFTFTVSGSTPQFIDMPTFHTHNITNIGTDDLITFFWANELYDSSNPDSFSEMV